MDPTEEVAVTPKYTTTRRRWLTYFSFLLMVSFNNFTIAMFIPIV
jgi:hypothetical protein